MIIETYQKNHSLLILSESINKGVREFTVNLQQPTYSSFETFHLDGFRQALARFDELKARMDGKNPFLTKAVLYDLLNYLGGQDHLLDEAITHLVMCRDYDPVTLEQIDGLTGEVIHNALAYCLDPTEPVPQDDEEEEQLCLYH